MADSTNFNQEEESFDEFKGDHVPASVGKGMKPVQGSDMINFLYWVQRYHQEIGQLQYLSEGQLAQLANEFTGSRASSDQWQAGFRALLDERYHKDGYDAARAELKQLGI